MRTFFQTVFVVLFVLSIDIQSNAQVSDEGASQWFMKGDYLNGLQLKPHQSINAGEFHKLYQKNKDRWDKAFAFLKNTNLDTIRPGKYSIDGDAVFASVTFNPTKTPEQAKWEFHKKYTDIQYVISGKEKMGRSDVGKFKVNEEYNPAKDIGFGIPGAEVSYYEAVPGAFFIFFPIDAHCPGIRIDGCDKDKKIVIKVQND